MGNQDLQFGIIGLGKMGANLALNAMEKGINVAGLDKKEPARELLDNGLKFIKDMSDFKSELKTPRMIFVYIPAGPPVDSVIDQLADNLEKGDIIIDGGNSYWGDSICRFNRMAEKGIQFVDCGTSGGISGAREGACFMAGGEDSAIAHLEPILKELAVEGGYVHAGPPGAGHFVKLVHNGIEFGMLQAIGEGIDLLKNYHENLDIPDVIHCWRNGSVIRSWLIDLMEEIYRKKGGLEDTPAFVEDTGEVNWLVNDALRMEVPIPVISQSVMQLLASRDDKQYWARAVAMMRHGFGGHPFGEDEGIKRERREGKIGAFYKKYGGEE